MLTELHPKAKRPFSSMLDVLETCTILIEKETYPITLLELLATFSMRAMLQDSVNVTMEEVYKLDSLLQTPCV